MKQQSYDIIHEDVHLLVLCKNAGVLSIPDRFNPNLPNLKEMLEDSYGKIFIVHRLDRDTSGIMLFAKDADTHRAMNRQFEQRDVVKIYHVFVMGILSKSEIDIDIPLMPSPSKKGVMIPSARGKESLTRVSVIERYRVASLVRCELVTGRQHQIRAHLATVGHPLLVDELYGNDSAFYLSSIKRKFNLKKNTSEQPIIERLTMHAHSLEIIHPMTNEKMYFEAEYPKDFKALRKVLSKYAMIDDVYERGRDTRREADNRR